MNFPLTFAALVVLTGALVGLRFFWPRVSRRTQIFLIGSACVIPSIFAFTLISRWSFASLRVNSALYWLCIASYEFFLILFTRLRPRWLTTITAVVLLLPLLSTSIILPLTTVFDATPVTRVWLGGNFTSERVPWGSSTFESTGTDLAIYSGPSWAPLIRRRRQSCRYYNSQCDASHAFAVLQPDRKSVLMVCPASPGHAADSARSLVVQLH